MSRLLKVIASSVIRSSHQGDSHGGVYIIDLNSECYHQVVNWNDQNIDWSGRGGDRGLRGIAIYNDNVFMAASDEIFVYDSNWNIVDSFRNKYLKWCHEIFIYRDSLYITSTGFDSILKFDLKSKSFTLGYCFKYGKIERYLNKLGFSLVPILYKFDPNSNKGPQFGDSLHINNVYVADNHIYVAGTKINHLLSIRDGTVSIHAKIPFGTHNTRPYGGGTLLNETASERIAYLDRSGRLMKSFPIKKYPQNSLSMSNLPEDHARQGFGRGLCATEDIIIGGSSPASISVYNFHSLEVVKVVNISMDIRNAIHGLEIWQD